MQKFRNLTKNIFFKIFLIFIAITFVGFGMTDIFSGGGNWIAKIGDQTITYEEYRKKLNQTSSLIYNSNPTEEKIIVRVFPTKAVDATGAGDLFAAGALYGIIRNYSLEDSAIIGSYCASKVISHMGGRMPVGSDVNAEKIIQKYQKL